MLGGSPHNGHVKRQQSFVSSSRLFILAYLAMIADSQDTPFDNATCIQGSLAYVEGISLLGLRAASTDLKALGRMPQLRILILDGAMTDSTLSGFLIPRLALLSWRVAGGPPLPFASDTVKAAAVLDFSRDEEKFDFDVEPFLDDSIQARFLPVAYT